MPTTRPLLGSVPDGPAKTARHRGRRAGRDGHRGDRAPTTARSRPTPIARTPRAGVYVPTVVPAVPHWGKRTPVGHDQRRPVPPGPAARA